MKKNIIITTILFLIFTLVVKFVPAVTDFDCDTIQSVQQTLQNVPLWIPNLGGTAFYAPLLIIPIIVFCIYFIKNYLIIDTLLITLIPIFSYYFNFLFKHIIQRPRPPFELQIGEHSQTCSYVSTHTLVTFTVWGMVIYYTLKYCKNVFIRYSVVIFGIFWIFFVGYTRVWLGVHNPTDVIGGYILGYIVLCIFISSEKLIGGKV